MQISIRLTPDETNLPFAIDVGCKTMMGGKACIRALTLNGDVTVPYRPRPAEIQGLTSQDLRLVAGWIAMNESLLLLIWGGKLDELKFRQRMRAI